MDTALISLKLRLSNCGVPLLLPLRHDRPHIGFVWLLFSNLANFAAHTVASAAEFVAAVRSLVEDFVMGQASTCGRLWNNKANEYEYVSPDLMGNRPAVLPAQLLTLM